MTVAAAETTAAGALRVIGRRAGGARTQGAFGKRRRLNVLDQYHDTLRGAVTSSTCETLPKTTDDDDGQYDE